MEIFDFSKTKNGTKGFMVRVNKKEALQLIKSLSTQLVEDNPNTGRVESFAKLTDGNKSKEVYFSVTINEENEKQKKGENV